MTVSPSQITERQRSRQINTDTNILLVEDEQDLLELLRYNLTREGFSVETAMTGEDGLKKAREIGKDLNLVLLELFDPTIKPVEPGPARLDAAGHGWAGGLPNAQRPGPYLGYPGHYADGQGRRVGHCAWFGIWGG